jgi:hypothetical protein
VPDDIIFPQLGIHFANFPSQADGSLILLAKYIDFQQIMQRHRWGQIIGELNDFVGMRCVIGFIDLGVLQFDVFVICSESKTVCVLLGNCMGFQHELEDALICQFVVHIHPATKSK